jgi:hypothetical protein
VYAACRVPNAAKEVGSQLATVLKSQYLVILYSKKQSKKNLKRNKTTLKSQCPVSSIYSRPVSVCEAKKGGKGEKGKHSAICYSLYDYSTK